jgi:hypothetical protein
MSTTRSRGRPGCQTGTSMRTGADPKVDSGGLRVRPATPRSEVSARRRATGVGCGTGVRGAIPNLAQPGAVDPGAPPRSRPRRAATLPRKSRNRYPAISSLWVVLRRVKRGPTRAQQVEKSLQGDRFSGTRGCPVDPPMFTLVDASWTRPGAPRMDAARRSALAPPLRSRPPQAADYWSPRWHLATRLAWTEGDTGAAIRQNRRLSPMTALLPRPGALRPHQLSPLQSATLRDCAVT